MFFHCLAPASMVPIHPSLWCIGMAVVAHNSGGPRLDIIDDGRTGFLASTDEEYADALAALLVHPGSALRREKIAEAGRQSVATRFSEDAFAEAACTALLPAVRSLA